MISQDSENNLPSSIANPDLKIGTRVMLDGEMVSVSYSYPRWEMSCKREAVSFRSGKKDMFKV